MKTRTPGLLIPIDPTVDYRNLNDAEAVCSMPQHYLARSFIIGDFLDAGWKPRANIGPFRKSNLLNGGPKFDEELRVARFVRAVENSDLIHASSLYKKVSKSFLIPLKTLYNFAGLLRDSQKIKEARALYLKIIESDESSEKKFAALSYYQIGMIEWNNKKKAVQYFSKCLELMPEHREAKKYLDQLI